MDKFSAMEAELNTYLQSSGKGKGARGNTARKDELAFEKQLRQMERQNEMENNKRHKLQEQERRHHQNRAEAAAHASSEDHPHPSGSDAAAARKSISFSDRVQVHDAQHTETSLSDQPHHVMRYPNDRSGQQQQRQKPTDFYDLVDVVRFGERVEAPPTFDVVPNKKAAISRLAATLEQQQRQSSGGAGHSNSNRARLLSGGGNQQSEQKRLARMGLVPRNQSTTTAAAPHAGASVSKQQEMELLRAKVMATYQKNKRKEVLDKKGVNMKHQFPQFS
ncbi:hypothetical protein STCU_10504 [Strigomonas culicis]|uniref:Uncharacterized protein n=1 Tax=Strigomonas culicis TaxID=28005 RepID=S9USW3_9TRYP|nr:hypothetical protein STCU_10504 [Strigomonas culicis]|eukprot:EPY17616.1 hypothetical protein STCU_10504 [Strigomonas culicis]